MTRLATTSEVSPTERMGDRVSTETGFQITFTGPVNAATIPAAIRLDPAVPGSVHVVSTGEGSSRYTFVPATPLRPDARYDFTVSGVRDADGLILEPMSLAVRTVTRPGGRRSSARQLTPRTSHGMRPSRSASASRWTRAQRLKRCSVTIDGKQVPGAIAWADANTVLGFTPDTALPYDDQGRDRDRRDGGEREARPPRGTGASDLPDRGRASASPPRRAQDPMPTPRTRRRRRPPRKRQPRRGRRNGPPVAPRSVVGVGRRSRPTTSVS